MNSHAIDPVNLSAGKFAGGETPSADIKETEVKVAVRHLNFFYGTFKLFDVLIS